MVVLTDWNVNRDPPSANVITLQSGGTLTVVHVSGGTYAANEEEAAQIRLDLLNAALSGVSIDGIPRVFVTRGTDAEGAAIDYVELLLTEAEDLAAIVEASLLGMPDPSVVDQTVFDTKGLSLLNGRLRAIDPAGIPFTYLDLLDGQAHVRLTLAQAEEFARLVSAAYVHAGVGTPTESDFRSSLALPAMTAHVAWLMYSRLHHGAVMTGATAWLLYTRLLDALGVAYTAVFGEDGGEETPAPVFSEAKALLTLKKDFTSAGEVKLYAGGAIQNGAGVGIVSIVAGKALLRAQSTISGLYLAVNTMEEVKSISHSTINVFDVDGIGELSLGVELLKAEGGAVTVMANGGLVVEHADSFGALNTLTLGSVHSNLYVKDTGGSLHSEGGIVLTAAEGDLTVGDDLIAGQRIELIAGWYLGTFEKQVKLQAPALTVRAHSTVTLSGHIQGLSALDVLSDGNVNLLGDVQDHKGFTVFVPAVALEQEILQALEANLRAQAQARQALAFLEQATQNREIGQQDTIGLWGSAFLNQLTQLPFAVQTQQFVAQLGNMQARLLFEQDPANGMWQNVMEDMSLEVGGSLGLLSYTVLVTERQTAQSLIDGWEGDIYNANLEIVRIAGDVDELYQQLDTVNNTILRYNDLMQVGEGVTEQEMTSLYNQRSTLLTQIQDNEGQLAPLNRQIASLQGTVDTTLAQLEDLDAQIANLQAALNIVQMMINMPYQVLDTQLRNLQAYVDLLSGTMKSVVQDLAPTTPYTVIHGQLTDVSEQIGRVRCGPGDSCFHRRPTGLGRSRRQTPQPVVLLGRSERSDEGPPRRVAGLRAIHANR